MEDGKVMNKLNVLYEDNHIIVVEKPVNVLSQGDNTGDISLLDMVKEYVKEKYNKPGNVYIGLVHRLDRPVGGIMVFARTSKAASRLSKMVSEHNFSKKYYAVVSGKMEKESVKTVFENISALLNFCLVTGAFFRNFMLVWLYTGIFMGMYRLLNGPSGRLSFLTLKEMWKCGIYAAFPPMVIASLFPILELPFVTYETVFMIGLLIYWMAVTAKLERTSVETEENTDR